MDLLRPLRHRLANWARPVAAGLALAVLCSLGATPVDGAKKKPKRCTSAQVKRTVQYKKPKTTRARTVTACGAKLPVLGAIRSPSAGGVVAPVMRQLRRLAVAAAPASARRLQSLPAAKRVLAADTATDGGAETWFGELSGRAAGAARAVVRSLLAHAASSVTTGSDNGPPGGVEQGPAGTRTTMTRSGSEWNDASPNSATGTTSTGSGPEQNPGFDGTIETTTTSTRIRGSSSTMSKRTRIKVRMARCPDATGLGQGPVIYEQTSTQTITKPDGGRTTIVETSKYEGTLKAQFGDQAQLISADLDGTWSHDTRTRTSAGRGPAQTVSHRSVGGTSHDSRLTGGNGLSVQTTSASDDTAAIGGMPTGMWVSGIIPPSFAKEGLDRIVRNAANGACVRVVPDPTAITIRSGESVSIKAHPEDAGGPFAGRIDTRATGGTLTPEQAEAAPDASFTFTAPQGKEEGEHDTLTFAHTSKRGHTSGYPVQVTYKGPPPSHTYRILGAHLEEVVTATRPGSSFPGCPDFLGREDRTMTAGAQPPPAGMPGSPGTLLQGPQGWLGIFTANGTMSRSTTMHGCDLLTQLRCVNYASVEGGGTVMFQLLLPPTGPAKLQWFFNGGPSAGIGSEGAGTTCLSPPIGWTTDDLTLGEQTVPRAVFEASTPQTLSFALQFDLTDPNPAGAAQIHADEKYSMTIQRVRDDGSPL